VVGGYLRYLGLPYRKVAKIFKDVFDLNLIHPSFLAFNAEQAQNGAIIYEGIKQSIRYSPCVNANETGWRVNGENHWLWVFTNKDEALYQIDKSRGSKVVGNILGEKYQGVLVSDFYSAYNQLQARAKQHCLGHLLAELKKIQEKNKLAPESIDGMFCQELKMILKRTIDVWNEYHEGTKVFEDLVKAKEWAISRMVELLSLPIEHKDTRRVRRRIIRYNQELFTFLDNPLLRQPISGPKRQLRPKVIMRKITFGNRSSSSASNQAVMMSIRETSILNGIEPLNISLALSVKPLTSFTELPKIRSP
jgi:hypothetical protein